nr:MAG TPA: hypothetical protein [Caudoviricetes sp.]
MLHLYNILVFLFCQHFVVFFYLINTTLLHY